jgi:leucyl aminopeptidase
MKIGDVYGSYKGLTVEIGNTDAEGRLVAADCMAYVQKNYKVKKMVVVATLGALKNVLGNVYAGLFANNRALADSLMAAGEKCGEKLWPMPLDEAYGKMLASSIADLRNVSGEGKASIVSAAFLSRFVEKGVAWAHIDMSGMRLDSTGLASGFGVRLLSEFVKEL